MAQNSSASWVDAAVRPFVNHASVLMEGAPANTNGLDTFIMNVAVQFVCSWIAFGIYIVWDYYNYSRGQLEFTKLPSRHPMVPFWYSQIHMVPLVLFNQLIIWPLVFLVFIWPTWVINEKPWETLGWYNIPLLLALMFVSDQMWYWSHRFMHTPYAWKNWHKMHHIAGELLYLPCCHVTIPSAC
jgi:sterol desaturase/sphingolipid hydroxylase (fatty acid hydroxylase superfamily)